MFVDTSRGQHPGTAFLSGGGQLGSIIAAFDWARTPLGAIEDWPTSIKTTVGLIQRSPVPIVTLWGEQGTMIYNDAYSVFAGARHPRLLGSAVREGWPEIADFNDNVMKVGLAGGTLSYADQELTLLRSGAPEQVWMNLDYSPVIGESGQPIGVIAIVVETTRAVRDARQLQQSQARLQFLDALGKESAKSIDADSILAVTTRMVGQHLGASLCAYADMDADGNGFTIRGDWTAPGMAHITGHYSLAAFGKRAIDTLEAGEPLIIENCLLELPPEDSAALRALGVTATLCMPLVKEGRLTAMMAVHYADAHIWTADEQALITEVTERSWAHIERARSAAEVRAGDLRFREELARQVAERTAELQQSEKTIRTVFETSYMNQGLLTTDGKIVYVNATSLDIIKRRLEDVVGKDFADTPWFTGTPGMPDKIRDGIARVAAGESIRIAMPLYSPTGDRIYEFSMRPALDENGKVVALVPEAVEITARVRAEEALQQAVKLEAIGNLTGGIAHDFNNLLMAILGSLELLRKRLPNDPTTVRLIDNATEGARRGKSLTERMLAFARKQDLKPQRTDLGRLVGGMAELLERALGPTITVDLRIDTQLPPVEIDPNQMEAALLNLAVNARDAMNGQGPLVIQAREEIVAEQSALSPGRYVVLAVIDAGEGMDLATLKRATEPFFTTKGVGKGTGLGLSMVQGLAEQSGGRLIIRSQSGAGTTAEIWLPAAGPAAEQPPVEREAPASAAASEKQGSAPLTILVVDDDPLILMNIVDMLEDLGHSVIEASSAKQALEELGKGKFDLMVTDHAMPHMTGAQLIKEAQARWSELRVILATGYADLPPGANADVPRLSKPFAQSELAAALAKAVL